MFFCLRYCQITAIAKWPSVYPRFVIVVGTPFGALELLKTNSVLSFINLSFQLAPAFGALPTFTTSPSLSGAIPRILHRLSPAFTAALTNGGTGGVLSLAFLAPTKDAVSIPNIFLKTSKIFRIAALRTYFHHQLSHRKPLRVGRVVSNNLGAVVPCLSMWSAGGIGHGIGG